jgi:hypothetical protein
MNPDPLLAPRVRVRYLRRRVWVRLSAELQATSGALEHAIRAAWVDTTRSEAIAEYGFLHKVTSVRPASAHPIFLCGADASYEVEVVVCGAWSSTKLSDDAGVWVAWAPAAEELGALDSPESQYRAKQALAAALFDCPDKYIHLGLDQLLDLASDRAVLCDV